jgi:predicted nucleic acid-binding protein
MKGNGGTVTFDAIVSGTAVFVDANCLVYAVTADPRYGPSCNRLLERIDRQDIQGFTSAHVLSEMAHRVMTLEAVGRFGRPLTGMANWLRRHRRQQAPRRRIAFDEAAVNSVAHTAAVNQRLDVNGGCPEGNTFLNDQLKQSTNELGPVAVALFLQPIGIAAR